MKKYKFVGDSSGWGWDSNPVKGVVYDEGMLGKMYGWDWEYLGGIGIIERWNSNPHHLDCINCWEEVTDELVEDALIEKLTNLDQLYSQMIGVVEELWVDVNDDNIEKCSDPKLALELVIEVYKKHRRLVEVLDK